MWNVFVNLRKVLGNIIIIIVIIIIIIITIIIIVVVVIIIIITTTTTTTILGTSCHFSSIKKRFQPQLFQRVTTLTFHYQPFILLLVIAASCRPSCNSRISITGFSNWASLNLKKSFQVLFVLLLQNRFLGNRQIVQQRHNLITDVPSFINPR